MSSALAKMTSFECRQSPDVVANDNGIKLYGGDRKSSKAQNSALNRRCRSLSL